MHGLLRAPGLWPSRLALVAALSLTTLLGACAPALVELSRQQRVAKVRVESSPPGATVLVGGREGAATPTTVALNYAVVQEKVTDQSTQTGGVLGVAIGGTVALSGLALLGMTGLVESALGEDKGSVAGYTAGGIALGLGLIGLFIGIYALAKASTKRERALPAQGLDLGLRLPGAGGVTRLRIKGDGLAPPYDQLPLLRFDGTLRRWQAPGKPETLYLELRTPDGRAALPGQPPRKRVVPKKAASPQEEPRFVRPPL